MHSPSDRLVEYLVHDSRHYRTFRDLYRIEDLVTLWRNYLLREDNFNRYAEMTSHGPTHLEGVAGLVAQFTLPFRKGGGLNDSEMFVLKGMAHLHDIGMYTTFDPHFDDPFRIRKIHGYLSRETILRESALLFPDVDDRDAIRMIALFGSYHQGSAALSEAELTKLPEKRVMRIPINHGIHGTEENLNGDFVQWSLERELRYAAAKGQDLFHLRHTGEEICPFQLGALVKLIDGCDFQSARIGSIETLFRHADRNRSHLARTLRILEHAMPGSPSAKRAQLEKGFFEGGIFHFIRNLMIEKTMIMASDGRLQIVIKPAPPSDVRDQAEALIASMGVMSGGESETQKRLSGIRDLAVAYIGDPLGTVCATLGLESADPCVAEWNISNVPPDSCTNPHYLIARKYIHREYNDVRHAMAGPKGKDWPYCRICPNQEKCSLKERAWPTLERADGQCDVVAYEPKAHAALLSKNPHLAYRLRAKPPQPYFQRAAEERAVLKLLQEKKRLILAGPGGRGCSSLMAGVAAQMKREGASSVFQISFADDEDQIPHFIQSMAAFLAARGDFLLSNVIVNEVPSMKHAAVLLQILRGGRSEHRNEPLLMCLDHFNSVVKGEDFFKSVIAAFPCISCEKPKECRIDSTEGSSMVLIVSTKRPGDRWRKSGPFPIHTYEVPPLTEDDLKRLTSQGCSDPALAADAAMIWRAYGGEAFAIPIWKKYAACGWSP